MLGKFFDTIWPLKELLNYIFKKSLGDYITNDLDLNSIEVEIKNKAFISLTNLELNAQEINNKHLKNSPIKMLDGRINRLDLYLSREKIEFKMEEIFILLMPVFNLEKINTNKLLKKQAVNIKTDTQVENSIISNLLNSALSKLEISVKNVCIKILTYEVCNIAQDNPTFSIYLSKIEYKSNKDSDINKNNKQQTQEKLFFANKQLTFDKICVKVRKNIDNDEINFFNLSNLNDEKLFFNFFCDNSTIMAMNYSGFQNEFNEEMKYNNDSDSSILVNFIQNEKDLEGIVIDLALKRLEIILNPLQLSFVLNFLEVCQIIFKKQNEEKDSKINTGSSHSNTPSQNTSKNFESNIFNNQHKIPPEDFNPPDQNPIKIFNSKFTIININLNLDMFNTILIENTYAYEIPKLWSFYEKNYSKQIKTVNNIETHFSYLEDNFFLFNLNKLSIKSNFAKTTLKEKIDLGMESVNFKYVEYKNKIKREKPEKKLKFTNSKLFTANTVRHLSPVIGHSVLNMSNMNNISNNNYNPIMNISINASRVSQKLNEQSLHQTIYQSFESQGTLMRNNSKDTNNSGFSNTIFESAMESELILVNKYSKLLEYDYFYNSYNILTLLPQYQSEKTCFKLKLLKTKTFTEKRREIIEKKFINFMVGDLNVEFHPVLMFKATRLLYNNVAIINEIFYYFSNLTFDKNDFCKQHEKDANEGKTNTNTTSTSNDNKITMTSSFNNDNNNKAKQNLSDSHVNNLNNNLLHPKVMSTDTNILINNYSKNSNKYNSPSNKLNQSPIKLRRRVMTQLTFEFNEIKINISSFTKDTRNDKEIKSENVLNSTYFLNYYKSNIEDIIKLKNYEVPGYKINIQPDPLIEHIKSKENIHIKFAKTNCLIDLQEIFSYKNNITHQRNKGYISIKLGQLISYFNDFLILNYTKDNEAIKLYDSSSNKSFMNSSAYSLNKNESELARSSQFSYTHVINKNPVKKFITGNYKENKLSEEDLEDIDIDDIFNKNKVKFRNSDICIDVFDKNNIHLSSETKMTSNLIENSNGNSQKGLSCNRPEKSELLSSKSFKKFDVNKHITEFVKNVHRQYTNNLQEQESLEEIIKKCILVNIEDEIENNIMTENTFKSNSNITNRKFSRAQISINLNEINLCANMKLVKIFSEFLDGLMFSINLHKILNKSILDLYKGFKEKIYDSYSIKSINNLDVLRYDNNNNSNMKLNILNLSIKKVNISLDKFSANNLKQEIDNILILKSSQKFNDTSQSQNMIKITFNKIDLSQVGLNSNNEIFCKLNDLSIYLTKLKNLKNDNLKINNVVNDLNFIENYSTIIYTGETNQNSKIRNNLLELKLDFKEKFNQREIKSFSLRNFLKEEKNFNLNFTNFEEFINKNLIKINDLKMNISLTINNLIVSPIFKDYNLDVIKEIFDEFKLLKKTENAEKNLIQLLDKRNVDLFLDVKFNKFIVDIFYRENMENYDDYLISSHSKNWMRLIISFENISYVNGNTNSTAKFQNFAINLLQDLRVEEADSLLTDKIDKIGKEDSELKKLGFVEIVNSNLIQLNFKEREECIQRPKRQDISGGDSSNSFQIRKETKIDIFLDAFEFKFCKDSFEAFKLFIEKLNEVSSNTVKALKTKTTKTENTKSIITENNSEMSKSGFSEGISVKLENEVNITYEKEIIAHHIDKSNDKIFTDEILKNKQTNPKFKLEILEDYCEGEFSNELNDANEAVNQDIYLNINNQEKYDLEYYHGLSARTAAELNLAMNRNPSSRRRSSFEIIKNPENLEDSDENFLNSLKEITFNLTLINFRIYLFDGKDFDFYNSEKSGTNLNTYIKNKNLQLHTNSFSSSPFEIIEEYCSTSSTTNKISYANTNMDERKRLSSRDYDNQIGVHIQNFKIDCLFLNSISESNNISKSLKLKIKIDKFDINDYVKLSKYKKLLSKYEYDNKQSLIEIDIETNSHMNNQESYQSDKIIKNVGDSDVELEEIEVFLDVKILPINILLDQAAIIFLLEFFDVQLNTESKKQKPADKGNKNVKDIPVNKEFQNLNKISNDSIRLNSSERKEPIKLIFVRKVKLEKFFINFSYNSHSISISKIKNKNFLELINISNISDFRIFLKDFEFVGCLTVNDTIDMIVNYWKEDITKNQIISAILTSVSLIKPFTTIMKGFFDIFKQPWIYYKTEKSLKDGFSKGIKNFIFSFASQSLFLGEKIFVTIKNYLGSHENENHGNNLGKNSYYKKFLYYMNDSKKKYDEYYLKK